MRKRIEIEEGRWLDPAEGQTTVRDWAARWRAAVAPQLEHTTQASYRSLINSRSNPVLGNRELSSLRPITVTQIMASALDNDLISQTLCRGVRLRMTC
ncbi:hypothetical protein [Streptomyces sp. NPDC001292]|uniref:hypothetical protein n=1 Tax=Streptomyces sp. NPDC001292 TaxID=3364558 RepID=UPI0036B1E842